VTVTQLRVVVKDAAAGELGPVVRPDNAQSTLATGESLRLLMPLTTEGREVTVLVEGLSGGEPVAAGESHAIVAAGEVDVTVTLARLPAVPPTTTTTTEPPILPERIACESKGKEPCGKGRECRSGWCVDAP
jgi:hypothetical protein